MTIADQWRKCRNDGKVMWAVERQREREKERQGFPEGREKFSHMIFMGEN